MITHVFIDLIPFLIWGKFTRVNFKRRIWTQIDLAAENLGLDYDDWSILKNINHKVNNDKHPNSRLRKEAALIKIETLNGTMYNDCYEPLISLINLFDQNKWL